MRRGTSGRRVSAQGSLRARLSSWARWRARKAAMRARTREAPRRWRLARQTSGQPPWRVTPPGTARRRGQAEGGGLVGEERLEAGRGGEEDLEGGVHALRLYQRPIGLTRAAYARCPAGEGRARRGPRRRPRTGAARHGLARSVARRRMPEGERGGASPSARIGMRQPWLARLRASPGQGWRVPICDGRSGRAPCRRLARAAGTSRDVGSAAAERRAAGGRRRERRAEARRAV